MQRVLGDMDLVTFSNMEFVLLLTFAICSAGVRRSVGRSIADTATLKISYWITRKILVARSISRIARTLGLHTIHIVSPFESAELV